jgi:hypothetical protein
MDTVPSRRTNHLQTVDLDYVKPILSLLWESGNFTPDEGAIITQTIMDNLQRRVSAEVSSLNHQVHDCS